MFILPFLKYLKPYKFRLIIGIICLIAAASTGTSTIVLAIPALNVLFDQTKAQEREIKREKQIEKLHKEIEPKQDENSLQTLVRRAKTEVLPYREQAYHYESVGYHYAEQHPMPALTIIALVIIALSAINGVLVYVSQYQLAYTLYLSFMTLKNDLFKNILRQDMAFFAKHPVGYLISRIGSDVYSVQEIISYFIRNLLQQSFQMFFIILFLLIIDWKLTALAFVGLVPAGILLALFARKLRKVTRKQRKSGDLLSAVLNESLHNMPLVKALCTEDLESKRFFDHNYTVFELEMKRRIAKFASSPLMVFLGSVATGGILLIGAKLVLKDHAMEAPTFMAYLALLSQVYQPLKRMGKANVTMQASRISAERILEVLAFTPTVQDPPESLPPVSIKSLAHSITMENLVFSYGEKEVLHGVSLEIPKGKTTAIVGRSGSGKTTLANLLMRFYDPQQGCIKIDGTDLRHLRIKELRSLFGIVSQETLLFQNTVAHNISYGAEGATQEQIEAAAKSAYAHEFIMALDGGKGYGAMIGPRGSSLSGGQRQRLAIARVFCRNPQILILDEATSALDNESEAAVQEAFSVLMKNRTVLVIAHRLSTIMYADNIVVLDAGKVVEQGTHPQLMELGGHYAGLYKLGEFSE